MSTNAPPLILISRTMPSNPVVALASMLKRFWKVRIPPSAGTVVVGVTNSVLPLLFTSGAKASFGALAGLVVEVTHGTSTPVTAIVHPPGRVGAVTPSKFSEKVAHGVGVAVAAGGAVAVAVAVAVGVGVARVGRVRVCAGWRGGVA